MRTRAWFILLCCLSKLLLSLTVLLTVKSKGHLTRPLPSRAQGAVTFEHRDLEKVHDFPGNQVVVGVKLELGSLALLFIEYCLSSFCPPL